MNPSVSPETGLSASVLASIADRDERLEGLKRLVDRLAHDFNNMLVPLLGYASLIKDDAQAPSMIHSYATKLEGSARRTEELLETMLNAVRPGRRHAPHAEDFAGLLRDVLQEWREGLPPGLPISIDVDIAAWSTAFDGVLWRNALAQILSNARNAMVAGGHLVVRLRKELLTPATAAGLGLPEEVMALSFRDNGFGMGVEVLQRACEPFFSTWSRTRALGLGLTAVHSIVRLQGGQILIESAEDAGTTVTIWLPARPADRVPGVSSWGESEGEVADIRHGRILVVDADAVFREGVQGYLRCLPVDVVLAQDGVEGLRYFQRQPADFRLIVSSCSTQRMTGAQFWSEVRKVSATVPFLWTASGESLEENDAPPGLEAERREILKRPYSLRDLADAIRRRLG